MFKFATASYLRWLQRALLSRSAAKLCTPSVKDSRLQTAMSPGPGCLLAGVLDSWASSGLLCPVLCWIGLTPVLMTSSMTTLVRNDVIKTSSNRVLQ